MGGFGGFKGLEGKLGGSGILSHRDFRAYSGLGFGVLRVWGLGYRLDGVQS